MLTADSHTAAADYVMDLLTAALPGVPVWPPPAPVTPVAGPGVLVLMPELSGGGRLRERFREFRCQLVVLAGDTHGGGLLELVDRVSVALNDAGIRHVTARTSYQPPNYPAALPAQLVTLE